MLDRGEHPLAEFGILFPKIRDNRHIVRSGIQFLIHEFPQKFPRAETYRARRRFCDPLAQSKRQGKHNGNFWAKSARWARQALGALNQPALGTQGLPIHGAGDVRYRATFLLHVLTSGPGTKRQNPRRRVYVSFLGEQRTS
jgi:hypothetical protein